MALNLSNLKPAKGATKKRRQVGRGGKRGTYSGRGSKGQRARSGGKSGLKALGFKQTLQRIPKKRGFLSFKPKMAVVKLGDLNKFFAEGEVIDLAKIIKAGLVGKNKRQVKILTGGDLTKKLTVKANKFSQSALKTIQEKGGQAELVK